MAARLILLLSILLVCSSVKAVDRPTPVKEQIPVVAVLPVGSGGLESMPGSVGYGLSRSLANHLAHWAAFFGHAVTVRQWDKPVAREQLLDSLAAAGVTEVLIVGYGGRAEERMVQVRDPHRRRFMAMAEGCLRVGIEFERQRRSARGWEKVAAGSVEAVGIPDSPAQLDEAGSVRGLPYDRVVQQVVGKLGEHLPAGDSRSRAIRAVLPVKVYVSTELTGEPEFAEPRIRHLVEIASEQFAAQFGVALRLVSVTALPEWFAGGRPLAEAYPDFRRAVRGEGDTLVVGFNRRLARKEYSGAGWREEIGMARVGQRRVYMDLLPEAIPGDTIWPTVENSLTLLHEIGHALGGIHVSDINSVMAHRANWVNAAVFDRVNREIISYALARRTRFDDPGAYLRMVAGIVDSSGYGLADYPGFFHQSLTYGDNPAIREQLREAIGRKSFLLAADAVGLLAAGERGAAARYLHAALREDQNQAALYYYLSLAADGPQAEAARRMAERMGYMMAGDPADAVISAAVVDNARRGR